MRHWHGHNVSANALFIQFPSDPTKPNKNKPARHRLVITVYGIPRRRSSSFKYSTNRRATLARHRCLLRTGGRSADWYTFQVAMKPLLFGLSNAIEFFVIQWRRRRDPNTCRLYRRGLREIPEMYFARKWIAIITCEPSKRRCSTSVRFVVFLRFYNDRQRGSSDGVKYYSHGINKETKKKEIAR